jgi:hypothetical protein
LRGHVAIGGEGFAPLGPVADGAHPVGESDGLVAGCAAAAGGREEPGTGGVGAGCGAVEDGPAGNAAGDVTAAAGAPVVLPFETEELPERVAWRSRWAGRVHGYRVCA